MFDDLFDGVLVGVGIALGTKLIDHVAEKHETYVAQGKQLWSDLRSKVEAAHAAQSTQPAPTTVQ